MTSMLSKYILRALPVVLDRPDRGSSAPSVFQSGPSPKLSHDKDNWILHYGGAFNPPHIGHLAVLSHALTNHGTGLNIIAAMIDPKDDAYLMGKNAESREIFVITKTDRATLWRSAEGFPACSWIFEGSECYKPVFMKALQGHAQRAGFVVKFMQVRGPDLIRPEAPPSRGTSNCDSLLIVAGSRETESFSAEHRAHLSGYGPWKELALGGLLENAGMLNTWYARVLNKVRQILHQLRGHALRREGKDPVIWYCESESETGWKAYFVADASAAGDPISSTKIRNALKMGVVGQGVLGGIAAMALSPKLLFAMLERGWVRHSGRE